MTRIVFELIQTGSCRACIGSHFIVGSLFVAASCGEISIDSDQDVETMTHSTESITSSNDVDGVSENSQPTSEATSGLPTEEESSADTFDSTLPTTTDSVGSDSISETNSTMESDSDATTGDSSGMDSTSETTGSSDSASSSTVTGDSNDTGSTSETTDSSDSDDSTDPDEAGTDSGTTDEEESDTGDLPLDHPLLLTVTDPNPGSNWRIQMTRMSNDPMLNMEVIRDVAFVEATPQIVIEAPRDQLESDPFGFDFIRLIPTIYEDSNSNQKHDEGEKLVGAVDGIFRFVFNPFLGEIWEHRNGAYVSEFKEQAPDGRLVASCPIVHVTGRKIKTVGQSLWGVHEQDGIAITPKDSAFLAMIHSQEYLDLSEIDEQGQRHLLSPFDRSEERWSVAQEHYHFDAESSELMELGVAVPNIASHAVHPVVIFNDKGEVDGTLDGKDQIVASPCGPLRRSIVGLWINPEEPLFQNAHGAWAVAAYDLYPGWNLHSVKLKKESGKLMIVEELPGFRVDMKFTDPNIGVFSHAHFCLPDGHES